MTSLFQPGPQGLYDPAYEHDGCGAAHRDLKVARPMASWSNALHMLENLEHRGACGCEVNRGDGDGVLHQMPQSSIAGVRRSWGSSCPLPAITASAWSSCRAMRGIAAAARSSSEKVVRDRGRRCSAGERCRPTTGRWGPPRGADEPVIRQTLIEPSRPHGGRPRSARLRTAADLIRKRIRKHHPTRNARGERLYLRRRACRTRRIVYKGLLTAEQLGGYYPDLSDPAIETPPGAGAFALQHQHLSRLGPRPSVSLPGPQRRDQHLRGNRNWMRARQGHDRVASCSATTSRKSCRSSTPAAATRPCSITCWKCSCSAGARCPTPS